MSDKLSSAVN